MAISKSIKVPPSGDDWIAMGGNSGSRYYKPAPEPYPDDDHGFGYGRPVIEVNVSLDDGVVIL